MVRRDNSDHGKALEKIALNPQKFGFKNIVYVAIEPNLFDSSGRLIAQPDVILMERDGTINIVEYKGNGNGLAEERAKQQLTKASGWYGRHTKTDLNKIKTFLITGTDPKYKAAFK